VTPRWQNLLDGWSGAGSTILRLLQLSAIRILLVATGVLIADGGRAAESTNLPPVLAPPEFLNKRDPLPDLLLKDKRAGSYFTGFPAIGWDPESKFNYGAAVQWFDNGPADSPYFRYTPYRKRFAVAAAGSTGGSRRAFIGYDQPYIGDSPWRVRSAAFIDQNDFQNYFGVGEATLGPLTYPGSPLEYNNFDDYKRALDQVVNGQTWARYNDYKQKEAGGVVTVERDYLGGRLRPQIGLQISHINVEDYTGESVNGGIQQPTRLFTDNQAGNVLGFDGGWDNALKVGLTFDTRDFEPDPASGMMLQVVGRISTEALGSAFNYQQITYSARGYQNLIADPGRLILAGRLTYVMQFGDIPFYSASHIPFTDGDTTGLGGHATLRGFVSDRFVGEAMAYANLELRWSFGETMLWGQHLRFMLVPFMDTGSVFDSVSDTTLNNWKFDGGIGFRLAWNLSTVVSFDYARSGEGNLFYMELGHQF
jgi:hypothetical protein